MSSINEKKISSYCQNKYQEILTYHDSYFTRTYPLGIRIDSSNYNPIDGLMSGAQVVALNFQTNDENLLLYLSKFMGTSTGYLKKNYSTYQIKDILSRKDYNIDIEILSGMGLNTQEGDNPRDIADPYIEIYIRGLKFDEERNKVQRSHVITDNGFSPEFNFKASFSIKAPEHDFLVIRVKDKDFFQDDPLGNFAIPISLIRPGYRLIPLRDQNLNLLGTSHLFAKISLNLAQM